MTSNDNRCKHAMDCTNPDCEKKHRLSSLEKRKSFSHLMGLYIKKYGIKYREDNTRRFQICSFGVTCKNLNCGYYHNGFSIETRMDFINFLDAFHSLSKEKQIAIISEEKSKIPSLRNEDEEATDSSSYFDGDYF